MAALTVALPGTTPDYWRTFADDRMLATIVALLTREED